MKLGPFGGPTLDPALVKVKMKIETKVPPDPVRNRAKAPDLRRETAVRKLPRERATKIKIKSVLKYTRVSGFYRRVITGVSG